MKIRLVGRKSKLSQTQLSYVAARLKQVKSNLEIEIITTTTQGDELKDQPLYAVEDMGFFTKEIDKYLLEDKADIAVHSIKDVGLTRPKGVKTLSILNRSNPRDILIYNQNFLKKIKSERPFFIGTSSLRRQELLKRFFHKFLPFAQAPVIKDLRGNIDTRIKALTLEETDNKYCDAIIIATAGLNRVMGNPETKAYFEKILENTNFIILPLTEFPSSPGQGAICLEINDKNASAKEIALLLNDEEVSKKVTKERNVLKQYGGGCHQKFGVANIQFKAHDLLFAKGLSETGEDIDLLECSPNITKTPRKASLKVFDTRILHRLMEVEFLKPNLATIDAKQIFIANDKAVHSQEIIDFLKAKEVWVPGVTTFKKLLCKGIVVNGCCDNFGYDFLSQTRDGNFFKKEDVVIFTHDNASWSKQHKVVHTYRLKLNLETPAAIKYLEAMGQADCVFWSSFFMYKSCLLYLKNYDGMHASLIGRTHDLLINEGLKAIKAFPSMNVFDKWNTI